MQISIPDVVRELSSLPPERVAEVYDFVLFLKTRQGQTLDQDDKWSAEDMRDAANASQGYAEANLVMEEGGEPAG